MTQETDQLVHGQAQDLSIDRAHSRGPPMLGVLRDQLIDLGQPPYRPLEQLVGERLRARSWLIVRGLLDGAVGCRDRGQVRPGDVPLIQHLQRDLASPMPAVWRGAPAYRLLIRLGPVAHTRIPGDPACPS